MGSKLTREPRKNAKGREGRERCPKRGPQRTLGLAGWALAVALTGPACERAGAHGKNTVEVSDATFAREVEQAEGAVVVDFWAPWCGPCRKITPILDKLAGAFKGRVKVCKVNVDTNPQLSERFKISSIPCVILFRDGQVVNMLLGARTEAAYRAWFDLYARPGRDDAPQGG